MRGARLSRLASLDSCRSSTCLVYRGRPLWSIPTAETLPVWSQVSPESQTRQLLPGRPSSAESNPQSTVIFDALFPQSDPQGYSCYSIDSRFSVRGGFQLSLVAIHRSIWLPVTSWIPPTIRHPRCDPTSWTLFTSQRNRARPRECLHKQSTIPAVPHLNQQTHHRPSLFDRDGACRTAIASERWPPSRLRVG